MKVQRLLDSRPSIDTDEITWRGFEFPPEPKPSEGTLEYPQVTQQHGTIAFHDRYNLCNFEGQDIEYRQAVRAEDLFIPGSSFFLRTDPKRISMKEVEENFTERSLDDPFTEIDPSVLNSMRMKEGLSIPSNSTRIQLSESKPRPIYDRVSTNPCRLDSIYSNDMEFRAERMKQSSAEMMLIVIDTRYDVDLSRDLEVNFARNAIAAVGSIQVSKLALKPKPLLRHRDEAELFVFTADGLTYSPNGVAIAGTNVYIADKDLLYNLLPFLEPCNGEEPCKVQCKFQTLPAIINGRTIQEVFLLTELI